jgi:DNA primase
MNAKEAKQIKITDYLNIEAIKDEFFIKSPFDPNERTPSFKINTQKNVWYDFALGDGGNILDLVMKLNNCNLSKALILLENNNFSFSQAKITPVLQKKEKSETKINKIKKLENQALIDYLQSRKINLDIAKKYLEEIYYTQDKKNYFSLAFKNDNGGYETRNAFFKGCIGHKTITTIKSTNNQIVSIFEGFMDFLSAITYYKKTPNNDVIILNSLSMLKILDLSKYDKICLYLDNDKKGKEASNQLKSKYKKVLDFSRIYGDYKDFNEFLNR